MNYDESLNKRENIKETKSDIHQTYYNYYSNTNYSEVGKTKNKDLQN